MEAIINTFSVFMVLFAVIDIMGTLPILIDVQKSGKRVNAIKTTLIASAILFGFFYAGEWILKMFNVDFNSFAVAGSIVLFLLSLEMILGTDIFKSNNAGDGADIVPIAFPLIAGPGSITTLISLRAQYDLYIIATALALNLIVVFFVIKMSVKLENILGDAVNYIIKKFFGIILMAMAVSMFTSNIGILLHKM